MCAIRPYKKVIAEVKKVFSPNSKIYATDREALTAKSGAVFYDLEMEQQGVGDWGYLLQQAMLTQTVIALSANQPYLFLQLGDRPGGKRQDK